MRQHFLREIERLKKQEREATGVGIMTHSLLIDPTWREDIFKWARERLGLNLRRWMAYDFERYRYHTWDGTPEPLGAVCDALVNEKSCAVFSATGIGKTFFGAVVLFWFLDCWEGSQVITIAPKKDQLTLHIWKEVGRLWPLFRKLHPQAELMTLCIRMRPNMDDEEVQLDKDGIPIALSGWGAVGFPCGVAADEEVASRARGFHATDMLFIIEETTGVDDAILKAVKLTCVAPHNLRLFFGNPDSEFDGLSRASKDVDVVSVRASAFDHPNVVLDNPHLIPGATTKQVMENWKQDLGGEDSPLFQSRARGIPPKQASDALMRKEWLDKAIEFNRNPENRKGVSAAGLDVADSPSGDNAVIMRGIGPVIVEVKCARVEVDSSEWARNHVWPLIESGMVEPQKCGIDPIGIGAGAVNELRRLCRSNQIYKEVMKLGGADKALPIQGRSDRQKNLRAQMYWQARLDLIAGCVGLPDDPKIKDRLIEELLIVSWWTHNGLIHITPKEEISKALGRSPDLADAWVYWNWIRQYSSLRFVADASGWAP